VVMLERIYSKILLLMEEILHHLGIHKVRASRTRRKLFNQHMIDHDRDHRHLEQKQFRYPGQYNSVIV